MAIFKSYKLIEHNSLFEIPIYRISPTSFDSELEKKLDRLTFPNPLSSFEEHYAPEKAKEKYQEYRDKHQSDIAYPWKFNEIIGWILLNIDSDIFSGELFLKKGERIGKSSRRRISHKDEAFRFDVTQQMTNMDIYSRVMTNLKNLKGQGILKKRFIDMNRFETVGKYLNWKKMFAEIDQSF